MDEVYEGAHIAMALPVGMTPEALADYTRMMRRDLAYLDRDMRYMDWAMAGVDEAH